MELLYFGIAFLMHGYFIEGFPIRLWSSNSNETEGFVEAFYNGSWGLIGNPEFSFSTNTATFLCQTLGISKFGYGAGSMFTGYYFGHAWLIKGLECYGNETTIDNCVKESDLGYHPYSYNMSYQYEYCSKLYCVDYQLSGGESQNTGLVLAVFSGEIYTVCYDGFEINAADVVCNHLKYEGAVDFTEGDPGVTPIYNKRLSCNGSESSLSDCVEFDATSEYCTKAVFITCRAIRLTHWNEFNAEGAVEIYYNGSWGFIGYPGYTFNDVTASFLCKTFGFGSNGFSVTSHSLEFYNRKAWLSSLTCDGTETHVTQCQNSGFGFIPSLKDTYKRGTWLYCFDFNISSVRLVNGSKSFQGKVEVEVGGRWGSICTFFLSLAWRKNAGDVVCRYLGYTGIQTVIQENIRNQNEMFWMSFVYCSGNETSLDSCTYTKGTITSCYNTSFYLAVECIDIDECLSTPCLNGGTCEDGDQTYNCRCPANWTGDHCEIDINECESSPCGNRGSCEDKLNGYICHCAGGFEGLHCQLDIDECLSDPCENNGECINAVNAFTCTCAKEYEGRMCQDEVKSQSTLIIILASSLCVLFVCVVIIVCCCLRYRRKQIKATEYMAEVLNYLQTGLQLRMIYRDAVLFYSNLRFHLPNADIRFSLIYGSLYFLAGLGDLEIFIIYCLLTASNVDIRFYCFSFTFTLSFISNQNKDIPSNYQKPAESKETGYTNIYNSIKLNDTNESNLNEVYDEIKENDLDDYLTPVSNVGQAKDNYGYLSFANDEERVRYYTVKGVQSEDYSKLSLFKS